jgi:hypothetical protein
MALLEVEYIEFLFNDHRAVAIVRTAEKTELPAHFPHRKRWTTDGIGASVLEKLPVEAGPVMEWIAETPLSP